MDREHGSWCLWMDGDDGSWFSKPVLKLLMRRHSRVVDFHFNRKRDCVASTCAVIIVARAERLRGMIVAMCHIVNFLGLSSRKWTDLILNWDWVNAMNWSPI